MTAARRSTAVAFVSSGVLFASWVSRIPQIRSALQLSPADLRGVLLAVAVGSLLALPVGGVDPPVRHPHRGLGDGGGLHQAGQRRPDEWSSGNCEASGDVRSDEIP